MSEQQSRMLSIRRAHNDEGDILQTPPNLTQTMSQSSDSPSSVASASSKIANAPFTPANATAQYFRNLRIAVDGDQDEPTRSTLASIFRSQGAQQSDFPPSIQRSTTLPIPYRRRHPSFESIGSTRSNEFNPFTPTGNNLPSIFHALSLEIPLCPPEEASFSTDLRHQEIDEYDDSIEDPPELFRMTSSDPQLPFVPRLSPRAHGDHAAFCRSAGTFFPRRPLAERSHKLSGGVLAVQGAGIENVNGVYNRTGISDRVGIYSKRGIHHSRPITFTVFRSQSEDTTRRWYISILSKHSFSGVNTSTTTTALYSSPSDGSRDELPPQNCWTALHGSGSEGSAPPFCLWISRSKLDKKPSPDRLTSSYPTEICAVASSKGSPSANKVVQCCVCMDYAASHVFVPCGHVAVCSCCAKQWKVKLSDGNRRSCPIGRCKVRGVIRIYGKVVEDG